MTVNQQTARREMVFQRCKMLLAQGKQVVSFLGRQYLTAVAAECPVDDALSNRLHGVVVKAFHVTDESGIWENHAHHLFIGGGKQEVCVPVGPLVHALIDEMWITGPLSIFVKNTVDARMGDVQYNLFHDYTQLRFLISLFIRAI